jgi:hypothetical protein
MVKNGLIKKGNSEMKKLAFLILIGTIISCSTTKKSSSLLREDQFLITRKYIGNFLDYCHTGPEMSGGNDLIWIKTTIYNTYGKISVYGKACNFNVGDKIYLKPVYPTPEKFGNWVYQIENDSSVIYRVSEFRFENNLITRIQSL